MKKIKRKQDHFFSLLCLLTACLMLPACGFQPMYGKTSLMSPTALATGSAQMPGIQIASIPERKGQILRNALIDRMQPSGPPLAPHFRLEIDNLQEKIRDLDVTIRSDTTREQMRISATLKLSDLTTGEVVLTRTFRTLGSYNVLENEYSIRVSRQALRQNLLKKLAREIEEAVIIYVRGLPSSTHQSPAPTT